MPKPHCERDEIGVAIHKFSIADKLCKMLDMVIIVSELYKMLDMIIIMRELCERGLAVSKFSF